MSWRFLLFLLAIELCCATPDEEILHSSSGVTWYLRSHLLQSTLPYGPGLHIFLLRPQKAFLESDIIPDHLCSFWDNPIKGTPFIRALHKDESGREMQISAVYSLKKLSESAVANKGPMLSLRLHTPGGVPQGILTQYCPNITKSDKPFVRTSIALSSTTSTLSYPLPHHDSYIRVTALHGRLSVKIELVKDELLKESFTFFEESNTMKELWPCRLEFTKDAKDTRDYQDLHPLKNDFNIIAKFADALDFKPCASTKR